MTSQVAKKVLRITETVISWIVVVLAIGLLVFTIVSSCVFDRQDRGIFGYQFFIVQSDSMSATDFDAGDVVITKRVEDPSALQEGDIITFISQDWASFGKTVTHKIRKSTTDSLGRPGFVTYGTTTNTDDQTVVTYEYIIGVYQGSIPQAGYLFQYIKTTPGYIMCVLLPFLLVILVQGASFLQTFLRYRKEQLAALQAEKDELAKEREELQAMKEKLLASQARLENLPHRQPYKKKKRKHPVSK